MSDKSVIQRFDDPLPFLHWSMCECNIWECDPVCGRGRCGFCRTGVEYMSSLIKTRDDAIEAFLVSRGRLPLCVL
jgi:hypothetical protein